VPNLPSMNVKSLEDFKDELIDMRRGGSKEFPKPHKFIMLLAVINLFENGQILENKIFFSQDLTNSFEIFFKQVSDSKDICQPGPPFFHLRSSSFWKHHPKKGREEAYKKLSTSGGGVKRIQDNIEYAYFSETVYQFFKEPETRQEIKDFILALITKNSIRLKTVFHESFSLSRSSLQQVLSVSENEGESLQKRRVNLEGMLRQETNLGTRYIKSMPRYAVGTGLVNDDYNLTLFGKFVQKKDKLLEHLGTQWLMHYNLSAPAGPGPQFWHELIITRFRRGDKFCRQDIADQISQIYQNHEGSKLLERTARTTAHIFLSTYTKIEALGKLKILNDLGEGWYQVNEGNESPPTWSVAYAILLLWVSQFPDQKTINLSEFSSENGLANIFMIGSGKIASILQKMQVEGIVDVYRAAPPYQVVLLKPDSETILKRLYSDE
jgi:hypothetical protein